MMYFWDAKGRGLLGLGPRGEELEHDYEGPGKTLPRPPKHPVIAHALLISGVSGRYLGYSGGIRCW